MKYKQLILKFASILLIAMLTQKMVGGLYLHNWLHASRNIIIHTPGEKNISQLNCSCIDDFYVPFIETPAILVEAPSTAQAGYISIPGISLPLVPTFFQSLRGPPVS
jgi:hypothetical protein